MKYLLDTDITSYYLRGKYNLSEMFERKGIGNVRLSRVTVAELEVLAHRNPRSAINLSSAHAFSEKLGVVEIGKGTWGIFSRKKALLLNEGMKKGDFDILMPSAAEEHGMVVVTNNTKHYEGLVEVENWIEGC